jgi:hypothetical protein
LGHAHPHRAPLLCALLASLAAAAPAAAAEPKLTVSKAKLAAALKCTEGIEGAARTPVMLVTGTGVGGDEAYGIAKPAFDSYGAPACWVNFPNFTTADIQVSVQYLVYGLREMHRRAGRKLAVFGISQGGLLPRVALTYWPSLRTKVGDVVAIAGTQHGTTVGATECRLCVPAYWQQARGSRFLRALNAHRDETPGPASWTTLRSATDEVVRPTTGRHPTSALKGATNILIQDVCPGREVTHLGTALDSVSFAAADDAVRHAGPAKVSRLPTDVCSHRYAPGLDEQSTTNLLAAGGTLAADRGANQPRVRREPRLAPWARRR